MNWKNRVKELRTYTSILYIGVSIVFLWNLFELGMLRMSYQLGILAGVVIVGVLLGYLLFSPKRKSVARTIGNLTAIMLSVCLAVGAFGIDIANSLIENVTANVVQNKDISLVVLKDSKIQGIEDLKPDEKLGSQNVVYPDSVTRMLEEMKTETGTEFHTHDFKSLNEMVQGLYDKEVSVMILDEAYRETLETEWTGFRSDTRIIYSVTYSEKQVNISKKKEVCEDPFTVLISGIDTYGKINTVSRSDVNILAVVNPKQAKILLVSIPRDYYVPIMSGTMSIAGADGSMDKLTHSGLFGPECTVRTLENFFDIPINYYVRVNFTSLVDIVDAIGGITVVSDVSFGSFKKGENKCDGEEALAFARDRYSFQSGDRQRGKNQMKVIEAIVAKVSNPSFGYDYAKLFDAVKANVNMNFSDKEIKSLIQYQVANMPAWTVQSISVNGTDAHDYSYFYGSDLYVMYPDENSVAQAKEQMMMYLEMETEMENTEQHNENIE